MEISDMKLIIAIAQSGSISMAAKKLFKSQPNVSKELKALEEKYETKLFERSHSGVKITQVGEIFLNSAMKILSELSTLKNIGGHVCNMPREIHIGSVKLLYCLKGIQEWVDSLLLNKCYSIFVHGDSVLEIIEKVASGEYEIGYISVPVQFESHINEILKSNKIQSEQMVKYKKQLLIKCDHPLNAKTIIHADDLRGYPEIIIDSNNIFDEGIEEIGTYSKRVIVDGLGSVLVYLNFGKGSYVWTAPVPKEMLKANKMCLKPSTCQKSLMKDFIIYKETSKNSEITRAFVEALSSFIAKMKFGE